MAVLFFFAANALASINITCVPGSFVDGSVHSSAPRCVPCTAGKFTNIYNATACADCANHSSGTFSEDGATQCTVCPLGQYKVQSGTFSEDGATQCTECPLGKYHPSAGSTCHECAAGTITLYVGAGSCEQCTSGTFQDLLECHDCAAGTWTAGGLASTECIAIPTLTPTIRHN